MYQQDEQKLVNYERISTFFSRSRIGYFGMLCSIVMSGVLIAPYSSPQYVYGWAAAIVITYMPRLGISLAFAKGLKKRTVTPDNVEKWERRVQIHSFLPFLAFSSISLLPFHGNVLTGFMIAAFSLVTMLTGGIMLYRASLKVIRLYLYVSFACLIGRCLYENSLPFYLLTIYLSITFILVTRLLKAQYQDSIDNIAQRIRQERVSLCDPLTGLPNRRQMDTFMGEFLSVSKPVEQEFQVAMMDIDYFKQYNDKNGHLMGDELLVGLARLVKSRIRSSDLFVRFGGEEFALILTNIDTESAMRLVKKLMESIEHELGVSVSVGLVSNHKSNDFTELLELADNALYASKQAGRNRITCAERLDCR